MQRVKLHLYFCVTGLCLSNNSVHCYGIYFNLLKIRLNPQLQLTVSSIRSLTSAFLTALLLAFLHMSLSTQARSFFLKKVDIFYSSSSTFMPTNESKSFMPIQASSLSHCPSPNIVFRKMNRTFRPCLHLVNM